VRLFFRQQELSRLFWEQRVQRYERERDAWLKTTEQVASKEQQEACQEGFKTMVANNGYRDMGISNQEPKHCEKDSKDESYLRWCS
jgi:hypothetical protein